MAGQDCAYPGKYTKWLLAALSIALTMLVLRSIFYIITVSSLFTLTSFKDRAIGITVLAGMDASVRTKIFVGFILVSIVLVTAFYGLLFWGYRKFVRHEQAFRFNLLAASATAVTALVAIISAAMWYSGEIDWAGIRPIPEYTHTFLASLASLNVLLPLLAVVLLAGLYVLLKKYLAIVKAALGYSPVFALVIVTAVTAILYMGYRQPALLGSFELSAMLLLIVGVIALARAASIKREWQGIRDLLASPCVILLNLALPLAALMAICFMTGGAFILNAWFFIFYPALVAVTFAASLLLLRIPGRAGIPLPTFYRALVIAGTPLIAVPLSLPLVSELQYAIAGYIRVPVVYLEGLCLVALILAAIVLFRLTIKGRWEKTTTQWVVVNLYFPLLIAAAVLYRYYTPYLSIPVYDMFHHGEMLITTQQLFAFGSIPYVDTFPTHGLSDMSYQLLYSLINGYHPVEPLLWSWIPALVCAVLLYFLMQKIAGPSFSFLVLLFTPLLGIFGNYSSMDFYYYAPCLLPALVLPWVLEKMTRGRLVIYWALVLMLTAWRMDFGVAAMACSVFVMGLYYVVRLRSKGKSRFRELSLPAATLTAVTVAGLAIFVLLIVARGESPGDLLSQNLQFLGFQDATMSYLDIVPNRSPMVMALAVFEYVLLPCVALFYVIHAGFHALYERKNLSNTQIMLSFLAVFSLIMSVRTVGRHSLFELYNTNLFIFLVLCIPFLLGIKRHLSMVLFSGILAVYLIFLLALYPVLASGMAGMSLMPAPDTRFFEQHDWNGRELRVLDSNAQYKDITTFLNDTLDDKQTFFDFTNSPILYVFADKEDLSYIVPNLYQASDPVQKILVEQLDIAYEKGELPLVVFKQGNWWDNVDEVPNEVRSYRVTEFIYEHYHPAGYVGSYQIWAANNFTMAGTAPGSESVRELPLDYSHTQSYNLNVTAGSTLLLHAGDFDPQVWNIVNLSDASVAYIKNQSIIKIQYRSSTPGPLQIYYSFDGQPFREPISSRIMVEGGTADFSEITLHVPARDKLLTGLRLDPPENSTFSIAGIAIVEYPTGLLPSGSVNQNFDLRKLPCIWGTYDTKNAADNALVLQTLLDSETLVDQNGIRLQVNPLVDKSSGNYLHLRIKSDASARVRLDYGSYSNASITFDTVPSAIYNDYLIRISTQWEWMNGTIDNIRLTADHPVYLDSATIDKGD